MRASSGVTPDWWKGRRVLITGHTGFKGGWLALWLNQLGAKLMGFALPPSTEPNLYSIAEVGNCVRSKFGDVRDFDVVREALNAFAPEVVFHLAAQPIVRKSYHDPIETYATNVMGTVHVLEAARHCADVRVVVNVTSDKCYENPEWHWACREIDPMGGHDPYSSSKGCAEIVTSSYRRSFFSKEAAPSLASARAGNVIGGGDWAADRLVPDIMRAIAAGRTAVIRNPAAVRPWQHVLEPLSGYIQLAERLWVEPTRYAEAWNFAPMDTDSVPVAQVASELCKHMGPEAHWEHEASATEPYEAHLLYLDATKARRKLGWEPRWGLEKGLEATAQWYAAFYRGENMRELTERQIAGFQSAAPAKL